MLLEEQERRREANLARMEPPQPVMYDWDAEPGHTEVVVADDWDAPQAAEAQQTGWAAPPPYHAPPPILRHNNAGDMQWMMGLSMYPNFLNNFLLQLCRSYSTNHPLGALLCTRRSPNVRPLRASFLVSRALSTGESIQLDLFLFLGDVPIILIP
jgi:hypothetical protein